MNSPFEATVASAATRQERLRAAVDDLRRRRASGTHVPDASFLSEHPDLMPELGEELTRLSTYLPASADLVRTSTGAGTADAEHGALPESFPGYDIVREIHRGGQGVVYQAVQKSTRRNVALKTLHGGAFADARARARIEREVQILGQIDHPNVVGVHDSGSVSGCLYYAMDYVAGEPLDHYLKAHRLTLDGLLALFARICDGVNAAHLRGVIHRDLKPSNILIDKQGQPHVVDFGLAKLAADADSSEPDAHPMTMTGQFLGSVPWASPEQAEGLPRQIDMRTDVYSLGVLLYQFLTGKFPYEVSGKVPDVLQRIMKQEPARPSTIRRRLNDELDTIVLKCLAKEKDRRYQNAGEVARDIRHYLAGEPIEAKRDSTLYVLSKTLRRYRVPVAIGAAFIVLLAGFAVAMTLMWQDVQQQERQTRLAADFVDDVLLSIDPEQAEASVNTPLYAAQLETVENAARQAAALADEPPVEARVRNTIGRLFINLGRYEQAREQLETAARLRAATSGEATAETADSLYYLGWALKELGEFDRAEATYRRVRDIRAGLFGDAHPAVTATLSNLGQLYFAQRKLDQAEALSREVLQRVRQAAAPERDLADSLGNLGSVLRDSGKLDEAEQLLRQALEIRARVLGEQHFHTIVSMNKLGLLLRERGQKAEARALLQRTLELRRKALPDDHPHIAVSLANLGMALLDEGDFAAAAPLLEDALQRFERDPKANAYRIDRTLPKLAAALQATGAAAAAEQHAARVVTLLPTDTRPGREYSAAARLLLAELQLAQGSSATAAALEPPLRELLAALEAEFGTEAAVTQRARAALAACAAAQRGASGE